MKNRGTPILYIRCDNSGKNKALQHTIQQKGMNIKFEFTSPGTPQQNGRVERKFSILYDYVRSLLNKAGVTPELRASLWAEAANHATNIINALVTPQNIAPPYQLF
jgi:transposase InsO family protein